MILFLLRFWVAVQFQHLYALRRAGDSSSAEGCRVDSASIAWAFQSDCQDDLLNYVLPAESTWLEMQNLGIGLWYTNVSQLRTRVCKYQQKICFRTIYVLINFSKSKMLRERIWINIDSSFDRYYPTLNDFLQVIKIICSNYAFYIWTHTFFLTKPWNLAHSRMHGHGHACRTQHVAIF